MSELKVPTHVTASEIVLSDKRTLSGRVFIPASSSHHSGPMQPDEWLNQDRAFFPFLADNSKSTVLLNKDHVMLLSIGALPERDLASAEVPSRVVLVELPDRTIEGSIRMDMPLGHQRVLDLLNRPEPFLILRTANRWHLVHKSFVTRVIERQEP